VEGHENPCGVGSFNGGEVAVVDLKHFGVRTITSHSRVMREEW
jgi:hypothetical protein